MEEGGRVSVLVSTSVLVYVTFDVVFMRWAV